MEYRVFTVKVSVPIDGGTAERSYEVQVRAEDSDTFSPATMIELTRDALCAAVAQNVASSLNFVDVVNVA